MHVNDLLKQKVLVDWGRLESSFDSALRVMKKSKWPDFMFTVAVRLVCGVVFGGLACFVIFYRGILRASAYGHHSAVPVFLAAGGLAGGIVAVLTIPYWQTPWYKRDALDLGESSGAKADRGDGARGVKNSISIKVVGPDGVERSYSSMEDVPPEWRGELEAFAQKAAQEKGPGRSSVKTSENGDALTVSVVHEEKVSEYRIVDTTGKEQTYRSLDEMPDDLRAAMTESGENPQQS